jgi:hypothetical protein
VWPSTRRPGVTGEPERPLSSSARRQRESGDTGGRVSRRGRADTGR